MKCMHERKKSLVSNFSDIGDIKKEIYDMLTQPIPIGVTDEDDMNNRKPNTNIEQIVENAGNRVSVELTDQLWDLLKSNFLLFIGITFFFVNRQTKINSFWNNYI